MDQIRTNNKCPNCRCRKTMSRRDMLGITGLIVAFVSGFVRSAENSKSDKEQEWIQSKSYINLPNGVILVQSHDRNTVKNLLRSNPGLKLAELGQARQVSLYLHIRDTRSLSYLMFQGGSAMFVYSYISHILNEKEFQYMASIYRWLRENQFEYFPVAGISIDTTYQVLTGNYEKNAKAKLQALGTSLDLENTILPVKLTPKQWETYLRVSQMQ